MKIIDCFMYYDEDNLLDLRLNILNEHVSHFIICEATFNHKGLKKKLNFGKAKLVIAVPDEWIDVETVVDLEEVAYNFKDKKKRRF